MPPGLSDLPEAAQTPGDIKIHLAIERSLPEFTLGDRPAREVDAHLLTAADAILKQCYAGAEQNRKDLPAMVKAVYAHDEQALDVYRLRAGTRAAEILANALETLFRMAEVLPQ